MLYTADGGEILKQIQLLTGVKPKGGMAASVVSKRKNEYGRRRYRTLKKSSTCVHCGQTFIGELIKCNQCNENALTREKRARYKLKKAVISAYGGQCVCCGESEIVFLAIDHIHNDGAEHRREIGPKIYRWLRQQGFPKDNFQVMCYNCNMAKELSEDGCPHRKGE